MKPDNETTVQEVRDMDAVEVQLVVAFLVSHPDIQGLGPAFLAACAFIAATSRDSGLPQAAAAVERGEAVFAEKREGLALAWAQRAAERRALDAKLD